MVDTSDLFDQWFRIADTDRDGFVSGAEAVTFFQRSRLPQDTLFKVWKLVAGDRSQLTKPQFWATLRLVSLAQKHQGQLPEAEARSTLIGVGPALPPPLLLGLEVKGASGETTLTAANAVSASAAYAGGFPQLQEHKLQQYLHLFNQLDADRDGVVQGGDCFGVFMEWGLPRQALKDVWQVVAGDDAALSQQRFVSCLYLMDLAKQGRPIPQQLPPGTFPPGFRAAQPQDVRPPSAGPTSLNLGSMQQVQHDVFSNDLPTPQLPRKAEFSAPRAASGPSRVPKPGAGGLDGLDPLQRQRLDNDTAQASAAEAELRKAQADGAAAIARESFFREALQELTLFRSRTSAALLQAQEQLQSAATEADAMEARYESAWTDAQATQSKSTALLEELSQAKSRKLESTRKLEELRKDISAMSSITEDQVGAERQAVAQLMEEIARLEAEKEQRLLQQEALLAGRGSMQEKLGALKADLAAASAVVESTETELESLLKELEGGDDSAALRLQAGIRRTAALHAALLGHAKRHAIAVPDAAADEDADGLETRSSGGPDGFHWPQFAAVGARDWDDSDMAEPEIVDELPISGRLMDPNLRRPAPGPGEEEGDKPQSQQNGLSKSSGGEVTSEGAWAAF